jgi:hypothetical protein
MVAIQEVESVGRFRIDARGVGSMGLHPAFGHHPQVHSALGQLLRQHPEQREWRRKTARAGQCPTQGTAGTRGK